MYDCKSKISALSVALFLSSLPAGASLLTFTPNGDSNMGSVKCEAPVTALGNIPLKGGSASISGKVITIKSGTAYIDAPRTVLVGSVLRSEANLGSQPQTISGIALFLMGDWVDQINDPGAADIIFRKDGHTEGKIQGIENESLSLTLKNGTQERIPLSSILYIRSPRVFVFKIGLKSKEALQKDTVFQAESTEAVFRPTSTARTLSGSVIPQSEKKDDSMGLGLGNAVNGLGNALGGPVGLGGQNTLGGGNQSINPGGLSRMRPAMSNQNDNTQDIDDEANRFSTVRTKWGTQKMTIPPGILD